ncbi:uncharacterized protein EV422DRAFT_593484 [Fimicolochytrium jonesii]|uniref:uncharacterized protein n=1 Tax=Fimicolochytrium jonesii TaxID=1396493 RepID=UPI0022FEBA50|nr:uncharacterized protein EV422DRAFT_593484 [Fimicolochytrium jonesii]KAI8826887.1 hypothetical protein EV422DRAFT_593484 [Fimicolochytrium jonesii]
MASTVGRLRKAPRKPVPVASSLPQHERLDGSSGGQSTHPRTTSVGSGGSGQHPHRQPHNSGSPSEFTLRYQEAWSGLPVTRRCPNTDIVDVIDVTSPAARHRRRTRDEAGLDQQDGAVDGSSPYAPTWTVEHGRRARTDVITSVEEALEWVREAERMEVGRDEKGEECAVLVKKRVVKDESAAPVRIRPATRAQLDASTLTLAQVLQILHAAKDRRPRAINVGSRTALAFVFARLLTAKLTEIEGVPWRHALALLDDECGANIIDPPTLPQLPKRFCWLQPHPPTVGLQPIGLSTPHVLLTHPSVTYLEILGLFDPSAPPFLPLPPAHTPTRDQLRKAVFTKIAREVPRHQQADVVGALAWGEKLYGLHVADRSFPREVAAGGAWVVCADEGVQPVAVGREPQEAGMMMHSPQPWNETESFVGAVGMDGEESLVDVMLGSALAAAAPAPSSSPAPRE